MNTVYSNGMKLTCKSVLGGWQTSLVETGEVFGPVFNSTVELWNWQRITFGWAS